jgi:hypothetical protein
MSDEEMLYREMNPEDTFYMGDDEPNDDRPSDNEQEQNPEAAESKTQTTNKGCLGVMLCSFIAAAVCFFFLIL